MTGTPPATVVVRSARPHELADVGRLTGVAASAEASELLVAVEVASGDLVGTASVLPEPSETPSCRVREAEVRRLAVHASARCRGVGAALMQAAIDWSRTQGIDALVVETAVENVPAQRVCLRLGFAPAPDRTSADEPAGGRVLLRLDLRAVDGVLVRLVRADERDQVAELVVSAYVGSYDDLPGSYVESMRSNVTAWSHEQEVWVAQDRRTGQLLGSVTTPRTGAQLSSLGRPGELDFRLLAVDPAARGRGIGALLTGHVVTLARRRGLRRVVLNSGPMMTGAHRLYERLGFERLRARETLLPDGRPLHAYGLELDDLPDGRALERD